MEATYFPLAKRVDLLSPAIKVNFLPPLEVETNAVIFGWGISRKDGFCIRDCKEI